MSLLITQATPQELETVIDELSKTVGWTYKEAKKDDVRIFSYQSHPLGQFSLSGVSIIEFTLQARGTDCLIAVDSILKGNSLFGPLFDIWGRNEENIKITVGFLNNIYAGRINQIPDTGLPPKSYPKPFNIWIGYILLGLIFCYVLIFT